MPFTSRADDQIFPYTYRVLFKKVRLPPAANTEMAFDWPIAVILVPSIGSTAIETSSPLPDPTFFAQYKALVLRQFPLHQSQFHRPYGLNSAYNAWL